ncbi:MULTISPECIES: hypothetical protein [Achromobacter]|uniref:SPOR domain-containing protein n=1 Tax=Achromobacter xylosoxidans (strain A8) TaxID=762376 RepID=E3HYA2_ACHXA|nr:hypothetical protein [Achromobacter xylosoxidans]ADP20056.1 hypothetical protein AXYL_06774 [Achromobacter xylosoxidans A8]
MRALAWILALVIAAAGAGAAALVVYSLATERPPDLRTADPDSLGPSDEQVLHLDPNAGLAGGQLAPLRPNELRPLEANAGARDLELGQPASPAESWLISSAYGDGQAAERLAKALLAKGAPNDRIAIVRRTDAQGSVDWRVEVGPVTADQAVELRALLQANGLEFDLE